MTRQRLLVLYCGPGGCTKGFQAAGFHVTGVDVDEQPNYCGDEFVQDDALLYLARLIMEDRVGEFAGIHASPPCQAYVGLSRREHPDLVGGTRHLLRMTGLPYSIENVEGAPLRDAAKLCGSYFGRDLRRHRLFESNFALLSTPCSHHWQTDRYPNADLKGRPLVGVVANYGHTRYKGDFEDRKRAMGIDWMTVDELAEAVPPCFTEYIGKQLLFHLKARAAA